MNIPVSTMLRRLTKDELIRVINYLAGASCSSYVDDPDFFDKCKESIASAIDSVLHRHPTPDEVI